MNFLQEWSAKYWIDLGCPADKLVIGLAIHSRTFTLADKQDTQVGADISARGVPGPYTTESGIRAYFEVCAVVHVADSVNVKRAVQENLACFTVDKQNYFMTMESC